MNEWIRTADHRPPPFHTVIVWLDGADMWRTGYYCDKSNAWFVGGYRTAPATHWMIPNQPAT